MTDTSAAQERKLTFPKVVTGVAGFVEDRSRGGGSSRGERAELRRMHAGDGFLPEPFWRIVDRYDVRPGDEPFWIDVIPLMVVHPHDSELTPGRALARAGVSPGRVERWLRLDAVRARGEARRLLARLTTGLNWVRFARLLRFWSEAERLSFARDYFLAPEVRKKAENDKGNGEESSR